MADSHVPVTILPRTISQEPACSERRNRQRPIISRFLTIPSSLAPLTSSLVFLLSPLSSLTAWRWSTVENSLSPFTSLINPVLSRCEPRNLSSTGVTKFWRPRPDLHHLILTYFCESDSFSCFMIKLSGFKKISKFLMMVIPFPLWCNGTWVKK